MINIQDIIQETRPTEKEVKEKSCTVDKVLALISNQTEKVPQISGIEVGGSYAKGTWLADLADIDIFVKFNKDVHREMFTKLSKRVGYDALKDFDPYEKYAEHPYLIAEVDGVIINIVPCYDVEKGRWQSAADRSPYHTRHMQEHLTESQKDEVRTLKKFLKNYNIYGAEIASQGFSGYAAETLILNFGGFLDVIQNIANIKSKDIIGTASKDFDTAITITDPIDNNRNLAAAISKRNIALFILACRAFLKDPSLKTFKNEYTKNHNNWSNVICIKFSHTDKSLDVVWGQTKKALSALKRQLQLHDFVVIKHHIAILEQQIYIFLFLESFYLSKIFIRQGPNVFLKNATTSFIAKNNNNIIWVSDDMTLLCLEERQYTSIFEILDYLLTNPTVAGIPAGLHNDIKTYTLTGGEQFNDLIKQYAAPLMSDDGAAVSSR